VFLWRISNHATLDGLGGTVASARWHTRGRPIVYLSPHPAGALVEVLVHLEIDPARPPGSYRLMKAEAPQDVAVFRVGEAELPNDWRENLLASRNAGDEWLAAGKSALLEVPSAILPETVNYLLNPAHVDAKRVQVVSHESYPYDSRLFSGRTR